MPAGMYFRSKTGIVLQYNLRFLITSRKPAMEATGRVSDDVKSSPLGSGSPSTPVTPSDRAAAKRAEMRRVEQERRRREAVSILHFRHMHIIN